MTIAWRKELLPHAFAAFSYHSQGSSTNANDDVIGVQHTLLQAGAEAPSLVDLMSLLDRGSSGAARVAVAACAAHRLATLRERQLRARFGCPLLTVTDDGAAAEEGLDAACAVTSGLCAQGLTI